MPRRVLIVSTVPLEDDQLERLGVDPGSDEIKVVSPAAKLSRLDWLTNDEDEARREAATTAVQTANAVPHAAEAEIGDPDPVQAIEDALREWPADEVVVVTSVRRRGHVARGARGRDALPNPRPGHATRPRRRLTFGPKGR